MIELGAPLLVGVGGAGGALARHATAELLDVEALPVATLVVNVLGSFVLGLVVLSAADERLVLLVGTGACGSFTTFSSFAFETVRLWETDARVRAGLNAVANLVGSLLAVGLAWMLVGVS